MASKKPASTPQTQRTHAVIRFQVPLDDQVTLDFMEAQGSKAKSEALRDLVHLFVAQHGAVRVKDVLAQGYLAMLAAGQQVPAAQASATSAVPATQTVPAAEPETQTLPVEPAQVSQANQAPAPAPVPATEPAAGTAADDGMSDLYAAPAPAPAPTQAPTLPSTITSPFGR